MKTVLNTLNRKQMNSLGVLLNVTHSKIEEIKVLVDLADVESMSQANMKKEDGTEVKIFKVVVRVNKHAGSYKGHTLPYEEGLKFYDLIKRLNKDILAEDYGLIALEHEKVNFKINESNEQKKYIIKASNIIRFSDTIGNNKQETASKIVGHTLDVINMSSEWNLLVLSSTGAMKTILNHFNKNERIISMTYILKIFMTTMNILDDLTNDDLIVYHRRKTIAELIRHAMREMAYSDNQDEMIRRIQDITNEFSIVQEVIAVKETSNSNLKEILDRINNTLKKYGELLINIKKYFGLGLLDDIQIKQFNTNNSNDLTVYNIFDLYSNLLKSFDREISVGMLMKVESFRSSNNLLEYKEALNYFILELIKNKLVSRRTIEANKFLNILAK